MTSIIVAIDTTTLQYGLSGSLRPHVTIPLPSPFVNALEGATTSSSHIPLNPLLPTIVQITHALSTADRPETPWYVQIIHFHPPSTFVSALKSSISSLGQSHVLPSRPSAPVSFRFGPAPALCSIGARNGLVVGMSPNLTRVAAMAGGFVIESSNVTVPVGTKDLRAIIGDGDEVTELGGDDEGRLDVLEALESTVLSAKKGSRNASYNGDMNLARAIVASVKSCAVDSRVAVASTVMIVGGGEWLELFATEEVAAKFEKACKAVYDEGGATPSKVEFKIRRKGHVKKEHGIWCGMSVIAAVDAANEGSKPRTTKAGFF